MSEGLRSQRVLVVDDEEDARGLVGWIFRDLGCDVELASDGLAALEKVERCCPDLVVLDLIMPRVDGWSLMASLRLLPRPPALVVMTACGDAASFGRAVREGAAGYVFKPFRIGDFVGTCARIAEIHRRGASAVDAERRSEPRRLLTLDTRARVEGAVPAVWSKLVDLSPGGAQLDLPSAIPPGERVRVAFHVMDGERPLLELEGRVRWRREAPSGFTHGLALEDASPTSRPQIRQLLARD